MSAFIWNEVFVTGLESVDRQHHDLVDLINRLSRSLTECGSVDHAALNVTFDALRNYARFHFTEEEKVMVDSGVDPRHQQIHRNAHAQFIEQIASLWGSRSEMSNPPETILGFLASWLAQHILGTDQSLARQIKLIQGGDTPGRAFDLEVTQEDPRTGILLHAMTDLYHTLSRQTLDLAAANLSLEERVQERTQELKRANHALTDANRRLKAYAMIDGLLGIANRKCFEERFAQEWRRARRDKTSLALMMIDVDHFKRFNDANGHPAGDHCLQAIAGTALALMHRPGDLVARYGGEELVVVLPDTDLAGARQKGQEICAHVAALAIANRDPAAPGTVTVSIGVASARPAQGSSARELLDRADAALYRAKSLGRNRVCEDSGTAPELEALRAPDEQGHAVPTVLHGS